MTDSLSISEERGAEERRLRLSGALTIGCVGQADQELRAMAPGGTPLVLDLSGVDRFDPTGAWIVYRLVRDWTQAGHQVKVGGASPDFVRLIEQVGAGDKPVKIRPDRAHPFLRRLETIGA